MKAKFTAASLLALSSATAFAADVGLSLSVGQPGFYGRLDIGGYPPPPVIYQQPVIIERPVRYVETAPIYLRVPPGHAKHWAKHCRAYHACGQRVYFVQDNWYQREYVPRYHERHGHPGPREFHRDDRRDHHGGGRGHHDERHDERGPGHGNGHGNGHGRGRD